jgi:hypothetical protein
VEVCRGLARVEGAADSRSRCSGLSVIGRSDQPAAAADRGEEAKAGGRQQLTTAAGGVAAARQLLQKHTTLLRWRSRRIFVSAGGHSCS